MREAQGFDDPRIRPEPVPSSFDWRHVPTHPRPGTQGPPVTPRPDPTRVIFENVEPAPAEIIPDLDLIDITKRGVPVSAQRRKRALDKMAIQCIDRGEPFVYHGRRFPGADE